ncbi:MAG TPA: LUD domain-containing protein [Candidatus Limnocylindrales bacterium]
MTTTSAPVDAVSSIPDPTTPAGIETDPGLLDRVAERMRSQGIEAIVVDTAAAARDAVLARVPDGSEVHSGKSKTIEDLGLFDLFMASDRWDFVRNRLRAMDRATQAREMRKLGAAPDIELGSVAAVTEDGALVAASATGNQLAAYAGGAGKVILVVGAQKVVKDLDAALARIRDDVYPWENARVNQMMGVDTKLAKILVTYGEWVPERTTVILVREPVGV